MYNSKIDNKGNIITGTTAILIIAVILIVIFAVNSLNYIESENTKTIEGENFKNIIDDYDRNIEVLGRESIDSMTKKVYDGHIILNSRKEVKKALEKELNKKNEEYKKKYDIDIESEVLSVESSSSPWKVEFKVHIIANKGDNSFNKILVRNSSIEGLKDPLPYSILHAFSGIGYEGDTIYYIKRLYAYLFFHNVDASETYFSATSPLYIKKCPYDPYIHHGDGNTLDNCLKNGYFHESSDGSCYLCRLERKGVCPHYGLETFIHPHFPGQNDTVSCVDHVVFHDRYNGKRLNPLNPNSLILDDAHKKKYGLM